MKPGFPFAQSATRAHWPADIPHPARMIWKDSKRDFSALWRVPVGSGCDALRISLSGRYLIIVVLNGSIRLSHGGTVVKLRAGQAAAVSVAELVIEVPDSPDGENVFILHLFHRMPGPEKLGGNSILAGLVEKQGRHVPGIFWFGNSGQLRFEASPVWVPGDAEELLWRLFTCGLESTVRFIASGRRSCEAVKPMLRPTALSLAHLPKPVAELAW